MFSTDFKGEFLMSFCFSAAGNHLKYILEINDASRLKWGLGLYWGLSCTVEFTINHGQLMKMNFKQKIVDILTGYVFLYIT